MDNEENWYLNDAQVPEVPKGIPSEIPSRPETPVPAGVQTQTEPAVAEKTSSEDEWYAQDPTAEELTNQSMTKKTGETDEQYKARSDAFLKDAKPGPGGEGNIWWEDPLQKNLPSKTVADVTDPNAIPVVGDNTDPMNQPGAEVTPGYDPKLTQKANAYKDFASGPNAYKKSEEFERDLVPNSNMYDGLSEEEAWNRYRRMEARAESKTFLGAPIYRGHVVPTPKSYGKDDWTPNGITQWINDLGADAARDGGKWLVTGLAAGIDQLTGNNQAERLNKWWAEAPVPASVGDQVVKDTIQIGVAALAGGKLFQKAASSTGLSEGWSKLAGNLGGYITSVMAMSPDVDTMFTGDNASLFKLFDGAKIEKDGSYSSNFLKKKYNQLVDLAVPYAPLKGVEEATKWAGTFAKRVIIQPFANALFQKSAEKAIGMDLAKLLKLDTPEQIDEAVKMMQEHKEALWKFAQENYDDVVLKRTSMSALAEGATIAGDESLAARAMEAQTGAAKKGVTELGLKQQQPGAVLKNMQQNVTENLGGVDTINKTAGELGQAGINEIGTARGNVLMQEDEIAQIEQGLRKRIQEDPELGKLVNNFLAQAGIQNPNLLTSESQERVINNLVQGVANVVHEKNRLYAQIPQDVPIDLESFEEVVASAKEAGILPPALQAKITDRLKSGEDPDFRFVNNELLPELNHYIAQIIDPSSTKTITKEQKDALFALRNNFGSEQLNFIATHGDEETKKAAQAALTYYKEKYIPFAEDPNTPIGQIFEAYNQWNPELKKINKETGVVEALNQPTRIAGTRDEIRNSVTSLNDSKGAQFDQTMAFINQPSTPPDTREAVKDIFKGKVATRLSNILASGEDVTKITSDTIYGALADSGVKVSQHFPEFTQRVDKLINDLRAGSITREAAETELAALKVEAKNAEDRVYNGVLGNFLEGKGTADKLPSKVQNGYQVFKQMLGDENAGAQLDEILSRVAQSDDPMVKEGVKSAYVSYLQDIFENARTGDVNPAEMAKLFDPKSSLWSYGQKIFGGSEADMKTLEIYKGVTEAVLGEARKLSPKGLVPRNEAATMGEMEQGLSFVIKMIYGPLNRTGSKWQATGSRVLKYVDPRMKNLEILDNIHSDPDYAIQVFQDIARDMRAGFSPRTKSDLFTAGVLLGLYNYTDKDRFTDELAQNAYTEAVTPQQQIEDSKARDEGVFKKDVPPGVDLGTTNSTKKSPDAVGNFEGQVEKGNIDLSKRPRVPIPVEYDGAQYNDGFATVRSASFDFGDGVETLIPTVSPDGKLLSNDEAIALYEKTGQHLGKFDTPEHADAYAEALHKAQEDYYSTPEKDKSYKGSILPFSKDKEGKVSFDINAGLTGDAISGFTLPKDVYEGKQVVDPFTGEGMDRVNSLTNLVPGAALIKPKPDTLFTFLTPTRAEFTDYAERLMKREHPNKIFKETGMFQDLDTGELRKEIPDNLREEFVNLDTLPNVLVKRQYPDWKGMPGDTVTMYHTDMNKIMKNDKLEEEFVKAYQDKLDHEGMFSVDADAIKQGILNSKITFKPLDGETRGVFEGGNNISMNDKYLPQSVTGKPGYFEQHVAEGYTPEVVKRILHSEMISTLLHEQQHLMQNEFNHYGFADPNFEYKTPGKHGWDQYANQPAEKEPRNVQTRMNEPFSRDVHPWETLDEDYSYLQFKKESTYFNNDRNNYYKMIRAMGYDPDFFKETVKDLAYKDKLSREEIDQISPLKIIEHPLFEKYYDNIVKDKTSKP